MSPSHSLDPPLEATELGEISRGYNIRFERRSKHSIDRLWRAITNAEELERWMGYPARVDLRVGGDYFVEFIGNPDSNLDGVIVEIEPGRRLRYAWGFSVLEWSLAPSPEGDSCRYTFLHHGMPVRGIPEEEGVAAGWHAWLDELDAMLDGVAITREQSQARFQALCPPYLARIQAAIGPLDVPS